MLLDRYLPVTLSAVARSETPTTSYVDYVVALPRSQKAINALIFGIIAILSGPAGFVFGIPAVIIGHLATRDIKRGEVRGWAIAQWALALGYLAILVSVAMVLNYFG
jgi:hypothetical protein